MKTPFLLSCLWSAFCHNNRKKEKKKRTTRFSSAVSHRRVDSARMLHAYLIKFSQQVCIRNAYGQNERQMVIWVPQMINKFILLFNPAELFTTVAFDPHSAAKHVRSEETSKLHTLKSITALVQLAKGKSWISVCFFFFKKVNAVLPKAKRRNQNKRATGLLSVARRGSITDPTDSATFDDYTL